MNSCDCDPPIAPESASTTMYFSPQRSEDAAVDGIVFLVEDVEPGGIDVERVRVLHDELANAQQAGLRARLVAKLGLDLIPDLGKLLVTAHLLARDPRS